MPKRYRSRPYIPGVLRAYWGVCESGDRPSLVANGLKGDCGVLLDAFEKGKATLNHFKGTFAGFGPSLLQELEARGYDLTTIKFSIRKKAD